TGCGPQSPDVARRALSPRFRPANRSRRARRSGGTLSQARHFETSLRSASGGMPGMSIAGIGIATSVSPRRRRPPFFFVVALCSILLAVLTVAIVTGAAGIPLHRLAAAFGLSSGDAATIERDRLILWSIRLPRIAMAFI